METTRRNFLKLSLAGTAAVAGASFLAGCSPTSTAPSSGDSAQTDDAKIEASQEESCDIVVVGSGTSGTCAAIRAAELGANVIWLEKTDAKGGTSIYTEAMAGVNSQLQKSADISFDENSVFYDLMDYQDWGGLGKVVMAFVQNSGETLDWIAEKGAEVCASPVPGYPATKYLHMASVNGEYSRIGQGILEPLWKVGEGMSNLDFRPKTPAIGLAIDNGAVTGVYAQSSDGTITKISAQSVILASGGFASNQEMYERYTQSPYELIKFWGLEGRDGDGINMGMKAGANTHALRCLSYSYGAVDGTSSFDDEVNVWFSWYALLTVNADGDRFMDESIVLGEDTSKRNIALTAQTAAYVIADEAYVKQCADLGAFNWGTGTTKGELRESIKACSGIVKADTIEALAEAMGVDTQTLQASVDEYNAIAAGEKEDNRFKTPGDALIPVKEGPFYAAKLVASGYGTIGGLTTNEKFQVTTESGEVIPGLYATGTDNGSMYYISYPMAVMGGTLQGFGATSGRMAAEDACANL